MLKAASEGYLDDIPTQDIHAFERAFLGHFRAVHPTSISQLDRTGLEDDEFTTTFTEAIRAFRATWIRGEEQ